MSPIPPPPGNGICYDCGEGEYECAEENPCEPGGGGKPKYKWLGKVWMDNGNGGRIGVDVSARVIFKADPKTGGVLLSEDGIPKHNVDVKLQAGVKGPRFVVGEILEVLPDCLYSRWVATRRQREQWEQWYREGLDKAPEDG